MMITVHINWGERSPLSAAVRVQRGVAGAGLWVLAGRATGKTGGTSCSRAWNAGWEDSEAEGQASEVPAASLAPILCKVWANLANVK